MKGDVDWGKSMIRLSRLGFKVWRVRMAHKVSPMSRKLPSVTSAEVQSRMAGPLITRA